MAAGDATGAAYVRLISAERHVFVLERRVALVSGLMSRMLSNNATWTESKGEIEFPDLPAWLLERVIQYLHYKVKYENSKVAIPVFDIPPEQALELLMAANYLDC